MIGRARNSKLLLRQNLLLPFLIDALLDEHYNHGLIRNVSFLRHRAQFIQHELGQPQGDEHVMGRHPAGSLLRLAKVTGVVSIFPTLKFGA